MSNLRIGVIGAGNVGGNLGARLSKSGLSVQFAVKDGADTKELLGKCAPGTTTADNKKTAAGADVIFIALPAEVVRDVARELAKDLDGKIVVDCTNPLRWENGPVWAPPPEGSVAQAIAKAAPGAKVIKGWNTFGAEFHLDPEHGGKPAAQVFLAGDDADAKKKATEVATKAGFRVVDAGPLRNSAVLENVAMLWIHLAMVGGKGRGFSLMTSP